jgi:hypothetical protein
MEPIHHLLKLFLLSSFLFFSCEGPEGAAGPAGASGKDFDSWNYKEGFIRGTAIGSLSNGSNYHYSLDLQGNYQQSDNNYKIVSPTLTLVQISKIAAGDGELFKYAKIDMQFKVPNLSDLSSPSVGCMTVVFDKNLGDKIYHKASYNYCSGSASGAASISNLGYNPGTGIIQGNFSFMYPATYGKGSISIADGTFSAALTQTVARKAAQ